MPSVPLSYPCHNCRRRRLRCDKAWPSCQKCISLREECLGYGKQFKFVSQNVTKRPRAPCQAKTGQSEPSTALSSPQLNPPPSDPLFQDLSIVDRRYLSYYVERVCLDMVSDVPSSNPFRELIPQALAKGNECLYNILVATSALRYFNSHLPKLIVPSLSSMGVGTTRPQLLIQQSGRPWSPALVDALRFKQQAIEHMRELLESSKVKDLEPEVLLAAFVFFIDFDLIDVGLWDWRRGWKAHLDGAIRMMEDICPGSRLGALTSSLRDAVVSELFIYQILGTTLTTTGLKPRIDGYIVDLWPLLDRTETNLYLCCPQDILWIILSASHLASRMSDDDGPGEADVQLALGLLHRALAFDTEAWAARLRQFKGTNWDLVSKQHVASAHRYAACLYILNVIPSVREFSPASVESLVANSIHHLGSVGKTDRELKGTPWPTFVTGLNVRDLPTRSWVLKKMAEIFEICPWGYILTAIQVLEESWVATDGDTDESRANLGALQKLRAMNYDYLVV